MNIIPLIIVIIAIGILTYIGIKNLFNTEKRLRKLEKIFKNK